MRGRHVRLGELLLGVEGLALLRHLLTGDQEFADARVVALHRIVAALDGGEAPFSAGADLAELSVAEGYAAWSATYDAGNNPLIENEQPVVWSILDSIKPGVALDAACGTGRHTRKLVDLGHETIGVDATPEMLAVASLAAPEADLRHGHLEALPVGDGAVDLVVCALALTHLAHLSPAISEFARVLRPGGHAVLSDIHPTAVTFLGQAFFRSADGRQAWVRNHYHPHSSYLRAFAEHGLAVLDCEEPALQEGDMFFTQGLLPQFAPDAVRAAYAGLPYSLIWQLEKP